MAIEVAAGQAVAVQALPAFAVPAPVATNGMVWTVAVSRAAITDGGPNNSSNVAQFWAWDLSFRQYDFAKGATISVIMLIFVMAASVIYVRSTRHEVRG